jgi:PTH1 family peptidyl-tRNA hydrolase
VTELQNIDITELPALIVGLGNPGKKYVAHRHNVGFHVVDALARAHNLTFSRHKRAKARVAQGQIEGQPVFLVKPQTFMNLSGKSVARISREREIPPERILVVYDDLDLPLGRIRLRPEGGTGGHKGMRSIAGLLGTQAFPRLRVGISRPPGNMDPADYVLLPFADDEKSLAAEVVARAVAAVECWLVDGIVAAMDQFNRPLQEAEIAKSDIEPEGQEKSL